MCSLSVAGSASVGRLMIKKMITPQIIAGKKYLALFVTPWYVFVLMLRAGPLLTGESLNSLMSAKAKICLGVDQFFIGFGGKQIIGLSNISNFDFYDPSLVVWVFVDDIRT